jgi:hypothetical protein
MATRRALVLLSLLLLGGCFQQSGTSTSQLLPSNYQESYQLARTCRLSVAHNSNHMVVYANAKAESDYLGGNYPLPQGSTIVTAETDQANCTGITGYTLMFKEGLGYNSSAGDWHWQKLDGQRDVLQDGRVQECITCHATCGPYDYTCAH